jgi:hypothetical protein
VARAIGGRAVAGGLDKLREYLEEYFGAISQAKAGLNVEIPVPPDAFVKLQQCRALGLPLYDGGLMDQPHIWLLEIGVIENVQRIFDALEQRNAEES